MDAAKQRAIEACGTCGQPEDAHKGKRDDADALLILAALGGACNRYVASDASVIVQRYLGITAGREPQRGPGKVGKRLPLHQACGQRHQPGSCPFTSGTDKPSAETAKRGAAKAREALGLTKDNPEGS
jgi:hypothetical protein